MTIRYQVDLSEAERIALQTLLRGGRHAARKLKRAQILLAAEAGVPDEIIAQTLGVGGSTVYRTKRRFVEGNLDKALHEEPRPGARRKLTGQEEALLVATACSRPPEGRARWTIELLAGEMVRLTEHESLSRETVRRRLAENESSLGVRRCGACRRSMARTWPAWKTCSISEPVLGPAIGRTRGPSRPIRRARSCAWTRAPFS
jgi:transposase